MYLHIFGGSFKTLYCYVVRLFGIS